MVQHKAFFINVQSLNPLIIQMNALAILDLLPFLSPTVTAPACAVSVTFGGVIRDERLYCRNVFKNTLGKKRKPSDKRSYRKWCFKKGSWFFIFSNIDELFDTTTLYPETSTIRLPQNNVYHAFDQCLQALRFDCIKMFVKFVGAKRNTEITAECVARSNTSVKWRLKWPSRIKGARRSDSDWDASCATGLPPKTLFLHTPEAQQIDMFFTTHFCPDSFERLRNDADVPHVILDITNRGRVDLMRVAFSLMCKMHTGEKGFRVWREENVRKNPANWWFSWVSWWHEGRNCKFNMFVELDISQTRRIHNFFTAFAKKQVRK